jgi:hypothetical protein
MKCLALLAVLLLDPTPAPAPAPLKIQGPEKADPYKLVELQAVGDLDGKALLWDITPEDVADGRELPGGKFLFVGPPGTYKIKLRAIKLKDGQTTVETARLTVTIGSPAAAAPKANPIQATARLRVGNALCTATIIGPRRQDGKWDVLSASHCTGGVGSSGYIVLKDGRKLDLIVTVRQTTADVTWLVTTRADLADLPFALLATADAKPGTAIWQAGYGVDHPEQRQDGTVQSGPDGNGQMKLLLNVSHGDSGGGIFRADTAELIAIVCCTMEVNRTTTMWGCAASTARRLRP